MISCVPVSEILKGTLTVAVAPHQFSNTDMRSGLNVEVEPKLSIAKSGLPSPFKSPATMDDGFVPTGKTWGGVGNVPSPLPKRTDIDPC